MVIGCASVVVTGLYSLRMLVELLPPESVPAAVRGMDHEIRIAASCSALWRGSASRCKGGYLNIGQAAQGSGLSAKTIRYYQNTRLMPAAGRTRAGYRDYDKNEVYTLRLIHRARRLGFSMDDIRRLLTLWQDRNRTSADIKTLALSHPTALDRKLAELQAMQRTLEHLVAHCDGDERPDCPILDDLAGPGARVTIEDSDPVSIELTS